MDSKQLERAAYICAHAINEANTTAPHLGTPGARQTHKIDVIAGIIMDTFQAHDTLKELVTGASGNSYEEFTAIAKAGAGIEREMNGTARS